MKLLPRPRHHSKHTAPGAQPLDVHVVDPPIAALNAADSVTPSSRNSVIDSVQTTSTELVLSHTALSPPALRMLETCSTPAFPAGPARPHN